MTRLVAAIAWFGLVMMFLGCAENAPESARAMGDPAPAQALAPPGAAGQTVLAGMPRADRAVRITVEMSVVADNVLDAATALRALVKRHEGYVSEGTLSGGKSHQSARFEVRVPSPEVGAFRAEVGKLGEVTRDSEKAEDVTEQRADIAARLRNARAQEKRLLELLSENTGSLADVIAVEKQLSEVREKIERIDAQQRVLEGQIAMATVKVSIMARHDTPPKTTGQKISHAASKGVEAAGKFVVGLVVVSAYAGPTLLIILVMLTIFGFVVRGLWRWQMKRRNRRARARAAQQPVAHYPTPPVEQPPEPPPPKPAG